MSFNSIVNDEACWLFCGYYDGGFRTRKLADPSISYILLCHFWEQKNCISNVKKALEMQRKTRQKQTQKCELELQKGWHELDRD